MDWTPREMPGNPTLKKWVYVLIIFLMVQDKLLAPQEFLTTGFDAFLAIFSLQTRAIISPRDMNRPLIIKKE